MDPDVEAELRAAAEIYARNPVLIERARAQREAVRNGTADLMSAEEFRKIIVT